ncbi:MFS transporter [Saccharothrix sp.]|uniref:MFS transporter n=1 Tax=Saccharothrix sp. TaxID=1873460 RepID=UPI0028117CCE|nr:MFS transporter [Saccharothrix sp.]
MSREWWGLGAVLAATFMTQVDGFVVNVASPSIQRDLGAGFDQVQFVGAAYVIAFGALLVTGARLGDRVGHRGVFLWGVAGFTATSLLCGVAPSADLLIAARFLQGATAAFMAPQVLAIIRATVPDEERRATAISVYGVVIGLGVICGIAGGGVLVDLDLFGWGWRPVLLVNVPVGLGILALGRLLPGAPHRVLPGGAAGAPGAVAGAPGAAAGAPHKLDLVGAALTSVALPALLVPLVFDGPWWLWLGLPVAAVLGVVLVVQQRALHRAGGEPLFPPRVVTVPGMRLSLLTVLSLFATNSGLFLVFTYYLQTGLGLSPLTAGLVFVPLGFGFSLGSALNKRLGRRVAWPVPAIGCGLLSAVLVGAALATRLPSSAQPAALVVMIALAGFGQGLVVAPLVAGILSRVRPGEAGAASGMATTVTQFGLALGVAVVGAFYRAVLGATPGDAGVPFADHASAFTAVAVFLACTAGMTGLLGYRLHRLPAGLRPPDPLSHGTPTKSGEAVAEPEAAASVVASSTPRRTG